MTIPLTRPTPPAADLPHDDVGYELGWDHARHGIVPPADHLHPLSPVRQGWQSGRARFAQRSLCADRHVRQWLGLRLDAWRRGQLFEPHRVNAALLRRIEVGLCPITREALGAGGEASAATVTRVNPQAAWAGGNLAVVSRRVEQARGERDAAAVMRVAQRFESAQAEPVDGLTARQWMRLAVWCAFATPLPHHQAAALPLRVLPPPRLHVLNAVQSLQVLLSLQVTRAGHARRCAALAVLMPTAETRHAFNSFMHTLLARRLARGRIDDPALERQAVEDLWLEPLLNRCWQRLALRLTETDCEHLVRVAVDGGLAGAGLRWLPQAAATEGWALRRPGRPAAGNASFTARPAAEPADTRLAPERPLRPAPGAARRESLVAAAAGAAANA